MNTKSESIVGGFHYHFRHGGVGVNGRCKLVNGGLKLDCYGNFRNHVGSMLTAYLSSQNFSGVSVGYELNKALCRAHAQKLAVACGVKAAYINIDSGLFSSVIPTEATSGWV